MKSHVYVYVYGTSDNDNVLLLEQLLAIVKINDYSVDE